MVPNCASGSLKMITFVKDCLGSVRGVVDLSGGTVLERNDYYAFGERVADSTMQTTSINRWRYNAKEEQASIASIPYLDYGARLYDPVIGRWMQQDILSFATPQYSPFVFCFGNPIMFIDPLGLSSYNVNGTIYTIDDGDNNFRMDVTQEQFDKLKNKFEAGWLPYGRYRNKLSKRNGFTTTGTTDTGNGTTASVITYHYPNSETYLDYQTTLSQPLAFEAMISAITSDKITRRISYGSNNVVYLRNLSDRIFNANQHVSVINLWEQYGKVLKRINKVDKALVIPTAIVNGLPMDPINQKLLVYSSVTDAAVSEISNILFTQAGVDFGGLMFGPVGAVAGGVVGAGAGAFLGDMVGNVFTGKWF